MKPVPPAGQAPSGKRGVSAQTQVGESDPQEHKTVVLDGVVEKASNWRKAEHWKNRQEPRLRQDRIAPFVSRAWGAMRPGRKHGYRCVIYATFEATSATSLVLI